MVFRSGPTQRKEGIIDSVIRILSQQDVFGAVRKDGGESLFSFGSGPSEVFDCCCGEFFEGHGPGEVGEAVGPCGEFFGG